MNDLDAALHQLYGTRSMATEPATLRTTVLAIPSTSPRGRLSLGARRGSRSSPRLALVAAGLSLVLVGGVVVTSGMLESRHEAPSMAGPGAADVPVTESAPSQTELVAAIPPTRDPGALLVDAEGRAYYIDRAADAVVMVDLDGYEREVATRGASWTDYAMGSPVLLRDGGFEVVIVDDGGATWAWRPTSGLGDVVSKGLIAPDRDSVSGPILVGGDPPVATAFVTGPNTYDLITRDPTDPRLARYASTRQAGPFETASEVEGPAANTVADLRDLHATDDGVLWGIAGDSLIRLADDASAADAVVAALPPSGDFRFAEGSQEGRRLYVYDASSGHLLVVDSDSGDRLGEWDLGADGTGAVIRGVAVSDIAKGPASATWITDEAIHRGVLKAGPTPPTSTQAISSPPPATPASTVAVNAPASPVASTPTVVEEPAKPIVWETPSIRLEADAVRLRANGKTFKGVPTPEAVSDVQEAERTLELRWREKGIDQRIYFYLTADDTHWWIREVWTYDGVKGDGKWIKYRDLDHLTRTPRGESLVTDLDLENGVAERKQLSSGAGLAIDGLRLTAFAPGTGPAAQPQPGCVEVSDDLDYDALVATILPMSPAEAEAYLVQAGLCYEFSYDRIFQRRANGRMKSGYNERWCTAPPDGTITGVWGGGSNVRVWVEVDAIGGEAREQPAAGWGCATD